MVAMPAVNSALDFVAWNGGYDCPGCFRVVGLSWCMFVQPSARGCIRVYEISQIRESVSQIPKKWQGRIWPGKKLDFQVWFVLVPLF